MRRLAFGNLPVFNVSPRTWEAPSVFTYEDLHGFFYEGLPYHGKPTRVFAWMGFPEGADAEHPVPGIVLVHGGGGTAFPDWVKLWNKLGFAAIAMDNCGGTPCWRSDPSPYHNPEWPRHDHSGPGGWGSKDIGETSLEDQWPFHAVGAVLNAFQLLASQPQVDAERIGITGISWGGFLTCLAASVEERFRFAMPVYGCGGFNTPMSSLMRSFTPEQRKAWFGAWDPDLYLPDAKMPFLWLTDAEDIAYPLDAWEHSSTLTQNPLTRRSLRIDYSHDHTISWKSQTMPAFAKGCLEGAVFPQFDRPEVANGAISCKWTCGNSPVATAELAFTRATGFWGDRRWHVAPAEIKGEAISANLPSETRCAFFQLRTEDGCLWTSPLVMIV